MANRALGSISGQIRIAAANVWRDQYNPLRGLTMRRAVQLLEEDDRGAYADLQWTYRAIERQDEVLGALIERRTSAIKQLDWSIKLRDDVPEAKRAVAALQEQALRNAYERVDNLTRALEALALASFRGYAHLEMVEGADGTIVRLDLVPQWHWVREGTAAPWRLNLKSTIGTTRGEEVDLGRFIIREVDRPINRVALVCFVRKSLSQKDWDAYVEEFGIPAVFIILPADVPADQLEAYQAAAADVTSNARGTLPGGSDVKTVTGSKNGEPFEKHLERQDKVLVLRGTGGLLTMLTAPGSGTLAGSAHMEAFEILARAEAAEISEVLQQQFDRRILAKVTPGERAWAYFDLAAEEETDSSQIVQDVTTLEGAGLRVDEGWIEEKSGYPVKRSTEISPNAAHVDANRMQIHANRPEGAGAANVAPPVTPLKNRVSGAKSGGGDGEGSDGGRDWLDEAAEEALQTLLEGGDAEALETALQEAVQRAGVKPADPSTQEASEP